MASSQMHVIGQELLEQGFFLVSNRTLLVIHHEGNQNMLCGINLQNPHHAL